MTSQIQPRYGYESKWQLGESGWQTGMDANLCKLDRLTYVSISGRGALPAFASMGQQWLTSDNVINTYVGTWMQDQPRIGMTIFDETTGEDLRFSNAGWNTVAISVDDAQINAVVAANAATNYVIPTTVGVPSGVPANGFPFALDGATLYVYSYATATWSQSGGASGGGAVDSVNGQTGAVTIAIPTSTADLSDIDLTASNPPTATPLHLIRSAGDVFFAVETGPSLLATQDLVDVEFVGTIQDEQVLAFDTAAQKWTNKTSAAGGAVEIFKASLGSDLFEAYNSWKHLNFDVELNDTYAGTGAFETTDGRFTAPKTGWYQMSLRVHFQHENQDGLSSPSEATIRIALRRRTTPTQVSRIHIGTSLSSPDRTFGNGIASIETLEINDSYFLNAGEIVSPEVIASRDNSSGSGTIVYSIKGPSNETIIGSSFSGRYLGA